MSLLNRSLQNTSVYVLVHCTYRAHTTVVVHRSYLRARISRVPKLCMEQWGKNFT